MQYRYMQSLVVLFCTTAWAQEPPAVAAASELSFFDFLGSMVAIEIEGNDRDEDAGWIDPLDLYENYETELVSVDHVGSLEQGEDVGPSEEVGEDE